MRMLSLVLVAAFAIAGVAQAAPSGADQAAIAAIETHIHVASAAATPVYKTLAERMAERMEVRASTGI